MDVKEPLLPTGDWPWPLEEMIVSRVRLLASLVVGERKKLVEARKKGMGNHGWYKTSI